MHAVLLDPNSPDSVVPLANVRLASKKSYDEAWLQDLLFRNPTLIPLDVIDPGAGGLVSVARELRLPKTTAAVFLDILGITSAGRLVLIECKLWRNPQARREVVAQLLEYAALIQQWSYADLTARLVSQLGAAGPNPLFELVRKVYPDTDEARFVDAVSICLRQGDFHLVIAGDGIRADVHVLAEYLRNRSNILSRLSLVEFQIWEAASGVTVVLPTISLRTEVITQRVFVATDGRPLLLEEATDTDDDEAVEAVLKPGAAERRAANRAFWDDLIRQTRFDHPDQAPPRHGGDNWVRVDLPAPGRLTLYRGGNDGWAGIFVSLLGEEGRAALKALESERAVLAEETGEDLTFKQSSQLPPKFSIHTGKKFTGSGDALASTQAKWLLSVANRFVTAFRPRLARLAADQGRSVEG